METGRDAHAENQEVVKEFLRAMEMDWKWDGTHLDSIPSLDEIQ
jgi:hypothetical protein